MQAKSNDVLTWSLTELASAIEYKNISPVEVTKLLIDRISKNDGELNSYITVMEQTALDDARKAEKAIQQGNYRGKLHGVPIAVKDNVFVKGVANTSASGIYQDYIPNEDAELIRRLKSSGATLIGKTNMHEFAVGGSGDCSFFGPARNPHHHEKMTGGSSSGSGAAVAGHLAYGAIGSDTGGSIRIPSSFCGIVGMKPTFGTVSKYGTVPLSVTLDHFGPMTKTVNDNAVMLNALAGYDSKDPWSMNREVEDFTEQIGESVKDFTVGIPSSYFFDIVQSEVRESVAETIKDLERNKVAVKPVAIDVMDDLITAFRVIVAWEATSALEKEWQEQPGRMQEDTRQRLTQWANLRAGSDYQHAITLKQQASSRLKDVFQQVDVMLVPTMCVLPPNLHQRELNFDGTTVTTQILGRLTSPINPTGFPAISVPGRSKNGLPVGLQFIGEPYSEKKLYQIAAFVETLYS